MYAWWCVLSNSSTDHEGFKVFNRLNDFFLSFYRFLLVPLTLLLICLQHMKPVNVIRCWIPYVGTMESPIPTTVCENVRKYSNVLGFQDWHVPVLAIHQWHRLIVILLNDYSTRCLVIRRIIYILFIGFRILAFLFFYANVHHVYVLRHMELVLLYSRHQ